MPEPAGLDGRDTNGVDDVGDGAAAGQVVDRLAQALAADWDW